MKLSDAQNAKIAQAALKIAAQRDVIRRLEEEAQIAKDNLKAAKSEMERLQGELSDATDGETA